MKKYGLIGYPLHHSFSKNYFSEKFENKGLDAVYSNFPLEKISALPELIKNNPDINGLNVTIPYKESVIPYLDIMDRQASDIGAVNVIKLFKKGDRIVLKGYNTDIEGFVWSLKPLLKESIQNALILGTGGASKAVAAGLKKLDISYNFVSRTHARASMVYGDITAAIIRDVQLIINTTPLGMVPDINSYPEIPYESLTKGKILFDLVYNPEMTLFLRKGIKRGCLVKNGYEMLQIQAEKAWEIWQSD